MFKKLSPGLESEVFLDCPQKLLAIGKSFSVEGADKLSLTLSKLLQSNAKIISISGQRRKLEEALFRANEGLSNVEVGI